MKKIIILVLILIGGVAVYQLTGNSSSHDIDSESLADADSSAHHDHDHDHSGHGGKEGKKTSEKKKKDQKKPLTPEEAKIQLEKNKKFAEREISFKPKSREEESLLETQRQLATFYNIPQSESDLINFLDEKGLEPEVAKDSNPYTGTMITVRTKKALPGTRYNHAQYFANERGESFLQHYSIEYRPGPDAFQRAQEMVESLYNVKDGKPSADKSFISYELNDGYILWIKKMGKNDLKDDPFNAYEDSDVGTIRMAIEMEIHEQGHEHDTHMEPQNQADSDDFDQP